MTLPLHYCTICLTVATSVSFFRQYYFSMSSTSNAESGNTQSHFQLRLPSGRFKQATIPFAPSFAVGIHCITHAVVSVVPCGAPLRYLVLPVRIAPPVSVRVRNRVSVSFSFIFKLISGKECIADCAPCFELVRRREK